MKLSEIIEAHGDQELSADRYNFLVAKMLKNPHRIFEYDGSYKCLDCKATWGAITNPTHPEMPEHCKK